MEKEDELSFVLNLIGIIENKKCLYDKRDPFYFNKSVKEKAWKDVGEKCNKSGTDCKHKWKLLRERFCKEVKKMDAPSRSGMCYREEWRFLQSMQFLKDSLAPRRTRDNIEEDFEADITCSEDMIECVSLTLFLLISVERSAVI